MAQPTRFGRVPRQKIVWEASEVLPSSTNVKRSKRNHVQVLETRAASPNAPAVVHQLVNEPQVDFSPPIQVPNDSFQVLLKEQDPLSLFLRFFGGSESLDIICAATNEYARNHESTSGPGREWKPVHPTEFLQWLGCFFYMANHGERNRDAYWQVSDDGTGHHMGHKMAKTRWEQIHRFLTFNNLPSDQKRSVFDPVEPIASAVRRNCQSAIKPSKWIAVDEAMIAFTGRTPHTVQISTKPIPEGYKVWLLADQHGYIWSWRWHSKADGPESIGKDPDFFSHPDNRHTIRLAPTYQVVQVLCQELQDKDPGTNRLVFLDNLFLTRSLAHTLLNIGVGVMGTTRKNHLDFPREFLDVKLSDANFTYGSCSTKVLDRCLCFLWQDNAPVIGITTAFSMNEGPDDYVIKNRKRPANNIVAAPVFGLSREKALPIPKAIDAYNNNHNLVDVADQLRSSFTCEQRWEVRNWRPLAYWLFDVCLVNSYLIWHSLQPQDALRDHHSHRHFREKLISQIFQYEDPMSTSPIAPATTRSTGLHVPRRMPTRRYCAYSKSQGGDCVADVATSRVESRSILGEVSGNASRRTTRTRSKRTQTGCKLCQVNLCVEKGCFTKFHAKRASN